MGTDGIRVDKKLVKKDIAVARCAINMDEIENVDLS